MFGIARKCIYFESIRFDTRFYSILHYGITFGLSWKKIHIDKQQEQLLKGCMRNERLSQKKLYELYYGRMMSVCMRYSDNYETARDVLNEGFLKVFKHLKTYEPRHSLESWMKRIMINAAIDNYRKNKKHKKQVDLEKAAHYISDTNNNLSIISSLSAQEIMKLVQMLSPAYRAVFNLYVIEGYKHREIAKMLEISVGSSKSNLAKAKINLRKLIAQEMPDFQYHSSR